MMTGFARNNGLPARPPGFGTAGKPDIRPGIPGCFKFFTLPSQAINQKKEKRGFKKTARITRLFAYFPCLSEIHSLSWPGDDFMDTEYEVRC